MSEPHDLAKYIGLNFHIDAETGRQRLFAHVDVSGLTEEQIAAVREYAIAMQPKETRQ